MEIAGNGESTKGRTDVFNYELRIPGNISENCMSLEILSESPFPFHKFADYIELSNKYNYFLFLLIFSSLLYMGYDVMNIPPTFQSRVLFMDLHSHGVNTYQNKCQ